MFDRVRKKLKGVAAVVGENLAGVAAGAVGALVAGPVGGAVAGAGVAGTSEVLRAASRNRTEARMRLFEQEAERLLAEIAVSHAQELIDERPEFAEAVFQNYRRCMDAMDEAVAPCLARLTFMYRDRKLDPFFRGIGRVLEDLSAAELEALQLIVAAALSLDDSIVEVYHWTHEETDEPTICLRPVTRGDPVIGMRRPLGATRVLSLLDSNGLTHDPPPEGRGSMLSTPPSFERAVLERLAEVVDRRAVETFPFDPDRPSGSEARREGEGEAQPPSFLEQLQAEGSVPKKDPT